MSDSSRRIQSLSGAPSLEGVDSFLFRLETLLPQEAEIMWVSPADPMEQIILVRFKDLVIYFCDTDLSSENFFNWNDLACDRKLRRCLDKHLKIDQAHTVDQLVLYIRQALRSLGMEAVLQVEATEDEAIIKNIKDGSFLASCCSDRLPKTYAQVKADIEEILEIGVVEEAHCFESFKALLESVMVDEFQGAFNFKTTEGGSIELTFQNGKKLRKNKGIRIFIDETFWVNGVSRQALVDYLTDEIKERLDDRRLEYLLFMNLFRQIAPDYPDLKYRMGLNNARFVSADRRQCYFLGIRGKVVDALKPTPHKFCVENGYRYGEIDCGNFVTESALRTFLEYDLGYASPKELPEFERHRE